MNAWRTVAAAVVLSAAAATPVFAQAAIQEPGAFAFAYPNRDVLNGGVLTPEGRLEAEGCNGYVAMNGGESAFCERRYHSYTSGIFGEHDRRRYYR